MKKPEELSKLLNELQKETKDGKIQWDIHMQTTEHNPQSEKPVEEEDGIKWIVDECYVSYYCKYKGEEFLMVTYEMLKTAGDKVTSTNLIFLPPLGIRVFHLNVLLPYSIETSSVLANQVHNLWELLLSMYKAKKDNVNLTVTPGILTIED